MKRSVVAAVIGVSSVAALCAMAADGPERTQVRSLHAQAITPASDALFRAESQPPATAEEWRKVAARAADLLQAAQALGSMDSAKGEQEWLRFAHALGAAAERAAQAARASDQDALVSANGEVVSVCEDCHAKYRDAGRSMKE